MFRRRLPARALGAPVVVAAIVVGLVLTVASPASAHDDLDAASPAPDTEVGAGLEQIELMFRGEPSEVQIFLRDNAGDELTFPATLSGTRLWTMPLTDVDLRDALYVIRWEGVATDGDDLEGFYTFEVISGAADAPSVADQIASGEVLPVDGVAILDDGPSPVFLVLLGVSLALGAWTIWLGFNRLGNRLAADVDDPTPQESAADEGDDR